ncbi:DEAD/DEAH box helicase [Lachnoclostridium phytofermentans]|uniref:DEAD/DEAH box helicase domain protein n=1 Tax=Lachnoclostridium phytofermentans (strain ATCC 700394 / DSM 18823 / ISDg) TaxID=357809 RepID=A9KJU0_LACP7|nr:DEAD/DEAH box helicase [Lachnoclostridium phytofermentans]ABX41095.1 DEAD/DEAH box helicase domain protein [Lachnoclostridium phytofermentans ISDg]
MAIDSMDMFDSVTSRWFQQALGEPTMVQKEAWRSIADGFDTLVSAPTGTGKTLSAFLVYIDQLMRLAREEKLKEEIYVIYVSPLKSLAGDIRENLKKPLHGILGEIIKQEKDSELKKQIIPSISVAVRTGDTTPAERRQMIKHPPHILITTPESLYLLLTSKSGQGMLNTARVVIIDELHALIDSKRGAHLMLSIARLDRLCGQPLQRIGLSATIEPLELAANYLSPEPAKIVAPTMTKKRKFMITSPLSEEVGIRKTPVWEEIAAIIYDSCCKARSVIAFVEGRRFAEKLAHYVNQLGGDGFARTHHGSLSKEQRLEVEQSLRDGKLRLLCATSSMELGIDVGEIDEVFQIGCPRTISSTMQRLGRAGHNPDRVSVMQMFPRSPIEGLYCGLTAEVAKQGRVEDAKPPRMCFDVLAQHLVSMATGDGYEVQEVLDILARAYPFREVTLKDIHDVLKMLAGDYEHEREIPVRPRILYDRIHDRVEGDPYSRMLAVSAGGTIPDKGLYQVKSEEGVKLGELDEEFVYESRVGEKFLLGTFGWKIVNIQKDAVIVAPASSGSAKLPFWKGEIKGRGLKTGLAFGELLRKLSRANEADCSFEELKAFGMDQAAATGAGEFIKRQIKATGCLPDDKTILIEHFKDETGSYQMMVHSVFGREVNEPLAILIQEAASRSLQRVINYVVDDDGFLLYPYDGQPLPEGLLTMISPALLQGVLEARLIATPLFQITFRYNMGRSMMMGVRKNGRQPLWVQRMRCAQMLDSILSYESHPIIRETKRECLEDIWNLPGLMHVIHGILSNTIEVREMFLELPSPMSLPFRRQTEGAMMYDYAPSTTGILDASRKALEQANNLQPEHKMIEEVSKRASLPVNEQELHTLLMIEGDMIAGELKVSIDWLLSLVSEGLVHYIEPGLWIATEQLELYERALNKRETEACQKILRRAVRYRGGQAVKQLVERYYLPEDVILDNLTSLCDQGSVIKQGEYYYHTTLYEKALKLTVYERRDQIKTLPKERFTALLAGKTEFTASPKEQLSKVLEQFVGSVFQPSLLENVLLPARVAKYRPDLLDALLSQGYFQYRITKEGISFHYSEDVDWEASLPSPEPPLEETEQLLYEAMQKRGASFLNSLTSLLAGKSLYEAVLSLLEKGLVCADSFVPIRMWLNNEKLKKGNVRQLVNAKVMVMSSGRFEVARPLKEATMEQKLERLFDQVVIVCRETVRGISWAEALKELSVWEYTERARRGYFVEGLSGIQFIREKDFISTMYTLEHPKKEILWLSAMDPYQIWGKYFPYEKERSFVQVAGTVVALSSGVPIAVFERQGKTLKVFDFEVLKSALELFVLDYERKCFYPNGSRLVIKEYPKEAEEVLSAVGFRKEITDYVLYRK